MGFFSSLTGAQKTSVPATGFYGLPKGIQQGFNTLTDQARAYWKDPSIYAPSALTNNQNQAISTAAQPLDSSTIGNIASTYMNPYDDSVINDINKQANGQYSTYKQALTDAGAFGSNRMALGANDIDQSRLNQINTFKQGEYNTALQTGLGQRQQQLTNLLGTGAVQQDYNTQVKQAPLQALQGYQSALGSFLGAFPNGSSQARTVSTGGGIGGLLGGIAGIGSIATGIGGLGGGLFSGLSSGLSSANGLGGFTGSSLANGAASGIRWNNLGGF